MNCPAADTVFSEMPYPVVRPWSLQNSLSFLCEWVSGLELIKLERVTFLSCTAMLQEHAN
eukprot:c43012_g1_i1 orf=2-178(-)